MPARKGTFSDLSPKTQARWRARFGGRGDLDMRNRRAAAAYDAGAVIHRREAGHETIADRPPVSALVRHADGSVGYVELAGLGKRDRARIGRHDSLLAQLVAGKITEREFQRRVSGWVPVARLPLVSTPQAAQAAVEVQREAGEPLGPYPQRSGR